MGGGMCRRIQGVGGRRGTEGYLFSSIVRTVEETPGNTVTWNAYESHFKPSTINTSLSVSFAKHKKTMHSEYWLYFEEQHRPHNLIKHFNNGKTK